MFCEWSTRSDFNDYLRKPMPIFADYNGLDNEVILYADKVIYHNNIAAIVLGILLPLISTSYGIYLYLGWKDEIDDLIRDTNNRMGNSNFKKDLNKKQKTENN